MWDDYYDASEHMKSGFYVIPKALDTEHFQLYVTRDFCFINEDLLKLDVFDLVTLRSLFSPWRSVSSFAPSTSMRMLRSLSLG
jgi:hypothetical protein